MSQVSINIPYSVARPAHFVKLRVATALQQREIIGFGKLEDAVHICKRHKSVWLCGPRVAGAKLMYSRNHIFGKKNELFPKLLRRKGVLAHAGCVRI